MLTAREHIICVAWPVLSTICNLIVLTLQLVPFGSQSDLPAAAAGDKHPPDRLLPARDAFAKHAVAVGGGSGVGTNVSCLMTIQSVFISLLTRCSTVFGSAVHQAIASIVRFWFVQRLGFALQFAD